LSASNAWAVGDSASGRRTLIEHWNGTAWCAVASPNPAAGQNVLYSVAAASPSEVWAAGYSVSRDLQHEHTLILRWDGTRWRPVPSPELPGNQLAAVTVISPGNAWAAGNYVSNHLSRNLALHWKGQRWQLSRIPSSGPLNDGIDALAATSWSDVMAFGYRDDAAFTAKPLVQRWNGRTWQAMTGPGLGGTHEGGYLTAARAFSPSNAWAVGQYFTTATLQSLIEHWNGRAWVLVPHPNPSSGPNFAFLDGTAGTSPSDLWAVGSYQVNLLDQTLIEHWNGTHWAIIPSPDPGGSSLNNILMAASATSSSNAWAVGFDSSGASSRTMILHWDGHAWTQISSP
jgi:hypothetical protein